MRLLVDEALVEIDATIVATCETVDAAIWELAASGAVMRVEDPSGDRRIVLRAPLNLEAPKA